MKPLATAYVIPSVLREGTTLPTETPDANISLSGSENIFVDASGEVALAQGSGETRGTITATFTPHNGEGASSKTFSVTVLPRSAARELVSYHRNPTTAATANNYDIAYSMHLAVANGDETRDTAQQEWTPFNENYGIYFARSSHLPIDAVDASKIPHRNLKDPSLFYTEAGVFGVVAVRIPRVETNVPVENNTHELADTTSNNDNPDANSILVAYSADLLDYNEAADSRSIIELPETEGVNKPYIAFDTADQHYVVSWVNNSGQNKFITLESLSETSENITATHGMVTRYNAVEQTGIDDYTYGYSIPVREEILAGLTVRLGRIYNTGHLEFAPIQVAARTNLNDIELPATATLLYSDSSQASLPIATWDSSEINLTQPGEYTLTATIKQTEYPIPFAEDRADPSVLRWDWVTAEGTKTKFLMIATNDIHGDCVWQAGAPHMPIRMADNIADLADTPFDPNGLVDQTGRNPKEHIIMKLGDLNAEGNPISGSFWAPELHTINGSLTVLFMPCFNNEWTDGAAHFAQLKKDEQGFDLDPTLATSWTTPQEVTRADGSKLAQNADGGIGMSLDMTYFVDAKGQSYYSWQQLGAVYLAKMDPTDPSKTTSDPVLIVSPEYAWDNVISEGPNVLVRDGKFYMIYSGSSVGTSYTTGLAIADASGNTDLLTPNAWKRLNYPIQKSGIFNGQWQLGTGHGMWSKDEDGNDLYVFHAYANETPGYSNVAGRDTFLRRVHWAADGLPIFDMDATEEVSPTVKVTQTVVVS